MHTFDQFDTKTRAEEGVKYHLDSPDGAKAFNAKGEPIILILLGKDSKAYRKGNAKINSRLKLNAQKKQKLGFDDDEAEKLDFELYSSCVTGWENILDKDGKAIPFTPQAAREMVEKYPLIFDQIVKFVENRANFLPPSASN